MRQLHQRESVQESQQLLLQRQHADLAEVERVLAVDDEEGEQGQRQNRACNDRNSRVIRSPKRSNDSFFMPNFLIGTCVLNEVKFR